MKIHPLATIVPPHTPDEIERLTDSMRTFGFDSSRPIITHEGMILDGRHRFEAAAAAGVDPIFQEWEPSGEDDTPAMFVLRSTYHRTLNAAQRATLAVELLPKIESQAKERKRSGREVTEKVPEGRTERESAVKAAKAAGTNRKYVEVAAKVKDQSPETYEKMKKGEVSVQEAKKAVERKPPERPKKADSIPDPIEFNELASRIRGLKKFAEELAAKPEGAELNKCLRRVFENLDNAANAVKFSAPYRACPYMPNCESGCKACEGRKWITRTIDSVLPEAMKA